MLSSRALKDIVKSALISAFQQFFYLLSRDSTFMASDGPFLVIAPHPDDETLGCGYFIARARNAGQRVRIVIVTDGGSTRYTPHMSSHALIALRRTETLKAIHALGADPDDLVFLDVPDGDSESYFAKVEEGLRLQVEAIRPRLLIAPSGVDKHADHRTVARAITTLYQSHVITCPVFEYPVWFWPQGAFYHLLRPWKLRLLRRVSGHGPYRAMKMEAMRGHQSQCPPVLGGTASNLFPPRSFLQQFFAPYEIFFKKPIG